MGFLDEYERRREERQRKKTEELIDAFGGPNGCLIHAFFPITYPILFSYFIGRFIILPIVLSVLFFIIYVIISFILILISLFIITPLKIFFYLISFGHWNGFENTNLFERLGNFWDWTWDVYAKFTD